MVSMSLLLALAFISTLKIEGREAKVITDVYGVLTSVYAFFIGSNASYVLLYTSEI